MDGHPAASHAPYLLGVDVSTTGSKALLIDATGRVRASASVPHPLATPYPLWAEQDPKDWWLSASQSVRTLLTESDTPPGDIAAIGLSGQMHSLVLLDEHGQPIRPAILWNDQRTADESDEIRARVGLDRLLAITGNDALTGFTAPKVLWVRRHEPDVYSRARHLLLPKDYVRFRLTGQLAMDKADGSGTLLFDLRARDWSAELLDVLDIPPAWLPLTFEGPSVTGTVSSEGAAATGLLPGTPVVAGAGDQAAGAIGIGAYDPGTVSVVLGTSGVVFAPTANPVVEPQGRLHAFCHGVPDRWHLMGVMLSAAGSLQWFQDVLAPDVPITTLLDEAATIAPGSDGLLFLPYLTGERTPHADPLARGAWVGLTRRHTRAHLVRALLEGVAFGLRESYDLVRGSAPDPIERVVVSGGGARSALWPAILASVLDVTLQPAPSTEGAAYGAALLAGLGAKVWPDLTDIFRELRAGADSGQVQPDPSTRAVYDTLYPRYRTLYGALRETFNALARY